MTHIANMHEEPKSQDVVMMNMTASSAERDTWIDIAADVVVYSINLKRKARKGKKVNVI